MSVPRSNQNDVRAEHPVSPLTHTTTSSSGEHDLLFYITAPWDEILKSIVPVGYEDETGFHFGETAGEITA